MNLLPNKDERAGILGMSGTGKSLWTAKMMSSVIPHRKTILFLPDYDPGWERITKKIKDCKQVETLSEFKKVAHGRNAPRLVVYFPVAEERGDRETMDEFADSCYGLNNHLVILEEVTVLVPTPIMPPGMQNLISRGRKRDIGVWWVSQRPRRIPKDLFEQSRVFYKFWINGLEDRKYIAEETHPNMVNQVSDQHSFLFYRMGPGNKVYEVFYDGAAPQIAEGVKK